MRQAMSIKKQFKKKFIRIERVRRICYMAQEGVAPHPQFPHADVRQHDGAKKESGCNSLPVLSAGPATKIRA
jgi:hypothetical protein